MKVVEGNYFGVSGDGLVRRLGDAFYGWKRGRVKRLNDLARANLPIPDGVVLTDEAHETFLEASGLLEGLRVAAWRGEDPLQKASEMRLRYGSVPMEAGLKWEICQAQIRLAAPIVGVHSENYEKGGLRTIPDVIDAVREAWLSMESLTRQIENAAVGEEVPTWSVLIQREISSLYTGWSATGSATFREASAGQASGEKKVALYDVEPAGGEGNQGMTHLTLEAASVLGTNAKIMWGLEGGRWYILSTEMVEDEKSVQEWLS